MRIDDYSTSYVSNVKWGLELYRQKIARTPKLTFRTSGQMWCGIQSDNDSPLRIASAHARARA